MEFKGLTVGIRIYWIIYKDSARTAQ